MRAAATLCTTILLLCARAENAQSQVPASSATPATRTAVDEQIVVDGVLNQSPALRAAFLDLKAARAAERAADATYVPIFTAALSGNHNEQPTLTAQGTTITSSDLLQASVGVGHQLPLGTQMSLNLSGNAGQRRLNPTPATNMFITLGPSYATELRATITQPLLRGAGVDVGEAPLRMARLQKEAARQTRDHTASETLRDALKTYWELAYATSVVTVQQNSLLISERQYEEGKQRAQLGLLAQADVLQLANDVAQLKENLVAAQANRKTLGIQLGALLGLSSAQSVGMETSQTPAAFPVDSRSLHDWIERAMQESSQLKELTANAAVARDQVRRFDDASQARLDLSTWASLQGLGYKNAATPFGQIAQANAPSIFVSLELELPFDNTQRSAQLQQALLEAEAAEARLDQERIALNAQIESQVEALRTAQQRIELAEQTWSVAQDLVAAEQGRHKLGTTTVISVLLAQQATRDAELRLLRARTDRNGAAVELNHLTGDLLGRYANREYGALR